VSKDRDIRKADKGVNAQTSEVLGSPFDRSSLRRWWQDDSRSMVGRPWRPCLHIPGRCESGWLALAKKEEGA